MTVDLLPEVARGVAGAMRAVLDRSPPPEPSAPAVAALLRQSSLSLDFIQTYYDGLVAQLDHGGLHPDVLLAACRASLDALDGVAESRRLLANLLAGDEQKAEFRRQDESTAALRRTFTEWQEVLSRPFPPLDLKKIEDQSRANRAAGRVFRLEKIEDLFPSHNDRP